MHTQRNMHVDEHIQLGGSKNSIKLELNTQRQGMTITGIAEEPSPALSSQYQLSPLKIVQPNYSLNEISSPGAPMNASP